MMTRSYDIVEWGRPLQEILRPLRQPQGTEVLVRVDACGVCHSDLHIRTGAIDMGAGRRASFASLGVELPFTMGHEIVGVVEVAGPEASVATGTRCVVYPWHGCGRCDVCRSGDEVNCASGAALGTRRPGGYAEHVMVPHPRYLLDYGSLPSDVAATCACSGLTAYSAWRKLPSMSEHDRVLIIGAGGLGLAALHLGRAATSANIVVADIDATKLKGALDSGAKEVVHLGTQSDPAQTDPRLQGRFRGVIDFVGSPASLQCALGACVRGGTVVVVGLFGGSMELSTALLPMRNLSLRGSYVGSLTEMQELLGLMQRGGIPFVPTERRPLHQANKALDDLAAGKVYGRVMLAPRAASDPAQATVPATA